VEILLQGSFPAFGGWGLRAWRKMDPVGEERVGPRTEVRWSRSQAGNGTLSFSIESFKWHPVNSTESRQYKLLPRTPRYPQSLPRFTDPVEVESNSGPSSIRKTRTVSCFALSHRPPSVHSLSKDHNWKALTKLATARQVQNI
jgi:hypothetical protein